MYEVLRKEKTATTTSRSGGLCFNTVVPISYHVFVDARLVLCRASGDLTDEDVIDNQKSFVVDAGFDPSFTQLIDLTRVTNAKLTAELGDKLEYAFDPGVRRSMLAEGEFFYGMSRMFQMLNVQRHREALQVYQDLDAALQWIELARDDYEKLIKDLPAV